MEARLDKIDRPCPDGFIANGLKGDRIVKLCGSSECLTVGARVTIGGAEYTVTGAAIAPIASVDSGCKKTTASVANTPSGCKSCGGSTASAVVSSATSVAVKPCTCATPTNNCQLVSLDRPLEDDYLGSPAIAHSGSMGEFSSIADNLGNGLFRFRINSSRLRSGCLDTLSLYLVQQYKGIVVNRIYSGISLPINVI